NSLNRLIRCVCGKKIGPDPRNFNQRVSLGRNDLLIRTFLRRVYRATAGILIPISNVHAEFTMIQAFLAQFATAETNFIYSSHPPSLRQQAQTDLAAGLHITFIFTDRHQNNKYDIY
ncbi:hypothetical protein L0E02_24255, partial [Klebsiella pneumoniae]|nr:hypothetical protein [Klebsiella pneumoniae]